mmetsp:Transcript_34858/g.74305  ORF Transcript_34858/g.74305 Transcript_34858/m.74305 type:complete len:387 (+) Transcript_34858:493-1653(+)
MEIVAVLVVPSDLLLDEIDVVIPRDALSEIPPRRPEVHLVVDGHVVLGVELVAYGIAQLVVARALRPHPLVDPPLDVPLLRRGQGSRRVRPRVPDQRFSRGLGPVVIAGAEVPARAPFAQRVVDPDVEPLEQLVADGVRCRVVSAGSRVGSLREEVLHGPHRIVVEGEGVFGTAQAPRGFVAPADSALAIFAFAAAGPPPLAVGQSVPSKLLLTVVNVHAVGLERVPDAVSVLVVPCLLRRASLREEVDDFLRGKRGFVGARIAGQPELSLPGNFATSADADGRSLRSRQRDALALALLHLLLRARLPRAIGIVDDHAVPLQQKFEDVVRPAKVLALSRQGAFVDEIVDGADVHLLVVFKFRVDRAGVRLHEKSHQAMLMATMMMC